MEIGGGNRERSKAVGACAFVDGGFHERRGDCELVQKLELQVRETAKNGLSQTRACKTRSFVRALQSTICAHAAVNNLSRELSAVSFVGGRNGFLFAQMILRLAPDRPSAPRIGRNRKKR